MRSIFLLPLLSACSADDPTAGLVSIELQTESLELGSRQSASFTIMGSYEDGTESDLSAHAELSSTDEDVLVLGLVESNRGHGIGEGLATVSARVGEIESNALEIAVAIDPVQVGDLVINEVLADDGDIDANGDGETSDESDEYIELVNVSFYTVDLSGVKVRDSNYAEIGPRHIFASPTHLRPGEAIVVFGGGSADSLSAEGAQFVVVSNEDSGLDYGLSLNNSGEYISLVNEDAAVLVNLAYGDDDETGTVETVEDASINRSPDIVGPDYLDHRLIEGSSTTHSPGTRANGSAFPDLDEWFSQLLPD
jgi:hypothetical protein